MILFDAFLDLYYAYDLNRPIKGERAYTTQPLYHSRPSVNLLHAGMNLKENRFRGRLALQGGDSVKANTVLEANRSLGHIQEAYLGIRVNDRTWLDGGIYLGHIGMESWISQKNMTYSRSLLLDYVPYYSLGFRLTHEGEDNLYLEAHLMNGWQNISETNSAKSVGFQIKKKFKNNTFTYNNFFGDEMVYPGQKNRFRTYHNLIFEKEFNVSWKTAFSFDVGTQAQQNDTGVDSWHATSLVMQRRFNQANALALRFEHYADKAESNVITNSPRGFVVQSSSINYDRSFNHLVWRSEIRFFKSLDNIYSGRNDLTLDRHRCHYVSELFSLIRQTDFYKKASNI